MIDLLPILELYNTYNHDHIFFEIAENMLLQYNELKVTSLNECAQSLHVSASSLSRYLKQLFYENFTVFKVEHLKNMEYYLFDHAHAHMRLTHNLSFGDFSHQFLNELEDIVRTIKEEEVAGMLDLIDKHDNIIFVGIPLSSEVWSLQVELILLGKRTSAFLDPNYQSQAVAEAGKGDLIIEINTMRQDGVYLSTALDQARMQGASIACISHAYKPSTSQQRDGQLYYGGANTKTDHFVFSMLLNYIGQRLREQLLTR